MSPSSRPPCFTSTCEGSRKLVFWSKPIDGRCSRDLERAIAAFQTHQGQRETAKLEPGGKSLAALRDAQRPRLRPLRGLEGTAVAFLGAGTDDDGDYLAGVVAKGMVIPSGLRNAIARLTVELQRRTRLLVVVELCGADAKGRFTARLMFEEGITWIDPASGRLLPSDQAPPEAVRLVTDCARAISGLVVTNRANMTLRTPVALKCLAGPHRPFDPAHAESLDIDPSSDDFPKRVMGAIFGALDGEPELSDEERGIEVAMLCEAMENGFPNQAECFLQLAQFHPDDNPKNPLDQYREKVLRLISEGKVNWANDLAGDFIGVGNYAILVQAETGKPVIDDKGNHFFVKKLPQTTVTFPMNDFIDHLESNGIEDYIPHMYQDSKGKVTIGIGTNLTDNGGADGAVNLLQGKAILKASSKRQLATAEQIRQDYETIEALNLTTTDNRPAAAEKYEPSTTTVISRTNAIEIVREFVDNWIARLMRGRHYLDFDKSPRTAQMALVDILYSKGFNGFIEEFVNFRTAYNRRDWAKTAGESSRQQNPGRNAIVKNFLLDNVAAEPFFIDARGRTISIDELD